MKNFISGTTLALGLLLSVAPLAAQGTLSGQVTGGDTGEPLPFVNVMVRGVERGTLTDASGGFRLAGVPAGTLVVEASSLGYRTAIQTVSVVAGQTATVDFVLTPRPLELGGIEVVVLRPDLLPRAELTEREVRRANPKDSGELLRNLDGVDAVRRGPLGLDPVVRGLRETQVGTYLDGTRLFPAGPARMDSPLTHLDPSAVQNIEVVKGPYALTWGAGNLSAIRVETAPLPGPGQPASATLNAGYDTNLEAAELSGSASGRADRIAFWAAGAWRDGSDYEAGGGDVIPADFRSWEGRGKVGFDVNENSHVFVSAGYQEQGPIDYPGRLLSADFFESTNLAAEWETTRLTGLLRRLEVGAYMNNVDHGMVNTDKPTRQPMDGRTPPFALDITVDTGIDVLGGHGSVELVEGPWSIRLGGDVYSANRDALRTIRNLETQMQIAEDRMWPDATIRDAGIYGRAARTHESGFRVAGTVRADFVSADAEMPSEFYVEHVEEEYGVTELDDTETNLSGALTLGMAIASGWDVSVGVGSAVRTADATERFSDRIPATKAQMSNEFMGNPTLAPERSNQVDLWLEGSLSRAAVSVNVFGRNVQDYITLEETDLPKKLPLSPDLVYRYVNGDATFYGAEVTVVFGLTDVLTAELGGSVLVGEDDLLNEPLLGIAPARVRLGLRYEDLGGRYFLEGTFEGVDRQDEVSESRNENPTAGYGVLDLRGGWAPLRGVNLRFGVENAFDKRYINHLNARNPFGGARIPEPGRVIFLDVGYRF